MQLGFVSAILPDLTCGKVFETAAELGYDCVEVMCWPVGKSTRRYAGVTHLDVNDIHQALVHELEHLTERTGVFVSGLGYYGNPLSPDREEADAAIAQVHSVIAACARLGISKMNTFIGRDWTANYDVNFERFLQVWKPIVKMAGDQGVFIGIENCPMLFSNDEWPGGKNLASSPAIWRQMFSEIPDVNFGLNYDPSHLVWLQMDEVAPIREFASRIFHVHAKDLYIDRTVLNDVGILGLPGQYALGRLPGRGQVRWREFFDTLEEVGYHGPVCVEVEDREYESSLEGCKQALAESAKFLRQYIPR